MKSFFFSNFRSFLGSILVGILSFTVISAFFLNQLADIFKSSIESAFVLFSLIYVILPIAFITIWFVIYARSVFKVFTSQQLAIITIGYSIYLFVSILLLTSSTDFNKINSFLVLAFMIGNIFFAIWFCRRGLSNERITEAYHEFMVSFSLLTLGFAIFFYQNFKEPFKSNNGTIHNIFSVYEVNKEMRNLYEASRDYTEILYANQNIGEVLPNNTLMIKDRLSHLGTSLVGDVQFIDMFKNIAQINDELLGIVSQQVQKKSIVDRDSIEKTASLVADLKTLHKEMLELMLREKEPHKNPFFVGILERLNTKYFALHKVHRSLLAQKWAILLEYLKYKALIIFAPVLLFLLCVQFQFYKQSENVQEKLSQETDKIIPTKPSEDSGPLTVYEVKKARRAEDMPELKIITSGISLIFLLIIPIFRPVKADNINLDNPFITFNFFQLFENNPQSSSTRVSNNYFIDSLYIEYVADSVKIDFKDFQEKVSSSQLYIGPQITQMDSNIKMSNSYLEIINRNLIGINGSFQNSGSLANPRLQFNKKSLEKLRTVND